MRLNIFFMARSTQFDRHTSGRREGDSHGYENLFHGNSPCHMLRHACGYKLANDGHDTRALQAYLGHRNIQNTTRYTALAQDRFKGFWRD
jgi:site-specific recombinase XerD